MNTDKSVQNQKVFVRLESVLILQRRYSRAVTALSEATTPEAKAAWGARVTAFEEAVAVLELPITKGDNDVN